MIPQQGSQPNTIVRSLNYRDLDALALLCQKSPIADRVAQVIDRAGRWYSPLKLPLGLANSCILVAERDRQICGAIQVAPFNRARSTWRVEWAAIDRTLENPDSISSRNDIGSLLLRHCFEHIIEASTWVLEVDVNDSSALALYRHNGFQPLANFTHWELSPSSLQELALREPDLPNLLPVRNTDAQLIYQLDTVSMPPLLRQVFDRQVHDFKSTLVQSLFDRIRAWIDRTQVTSNYIFETQRKAAIGYYQIALDRGESLPHRADLTVHPAYTWLYPELIAQLARACQDTPPQPLHLVSADYQPEREEYLDRIGGQRIQHSLLMSRSVWHKLRESKHLSLDRQQILAEMLQSLQPGRQAIPNRIEKNDNEE
jgi:ribosomal protein S18 acetylase RimI-like enzyme